ncbi:unnamed protein product [Ostreobium quekettii]|uniref:Two-component response regulator n=1 Tax=Ostreobium quekettii TaxID=121088 RepID=A0A8S1J807_9CHLO|nr:unnamed protein product [Ostreobium quekettii]|eukprot:evm.model.scf_1428.1 EVM.evm.TU.scf_1428.1   scf_1428:4830-17106(+)
MAEAAGRRDHSCGTWENFPAGLRVLVVDDDSLCLKVIEQMLRSCKYEVTTSITSMGALELLRDRKNDFDLVLSDVFMPDMDGFKLLGRIGLELGIPVIMMSSSGDTDVVLKGVTHGAVDFLIKPVRVEELRNVWQHVIRRRKDVAKEPDVEEGAKRDEGSGGDSSRKRKEIGGCRDSKRDDGYATKKPRVNWSVEMHQQFVNAVNQLGVDKAVPKKILELMTVKGLTRENVASHLQKYRQTLKRLMGVQRAGRVCPIPQQASAASQPGSEAAGTTASVPMGAPAAALLTGQLPGAPGFLGSLPQGMGNLLPALTALSSNPNLSNMQLQLQNMTIQGLPALGGLDAHSVLPSGGMLPAGLGLGMGMGSLQAQAQVLMSMGLMAHGVPQQDGCAAQQQQQMQNHHHGMSRSASVPANEMATIAGVQHLRRNRSAVLPTTAEVVPQGSVPASTNSTVNPAPIPILSSVDGGAMPGAVSLMGGLNVGATHPEDASPHCRPQDQAGAATAASAGLLELQVKQEEPGVRPPATGQAPDGSHPAKVLGGMGTGCGFMADEALLGAIGMDGELTAFNDEDYPGFGEAAGMPLEESKDTGMEEFLNDFLRDMNVGKGGIGQ